MFSFGIFTSHIPYIAMIAFYAFFLLFGAKQANEGKIRIAEKSHTIQIHIDNSIGSSPADKSCFYTSFEEQEDAFVYVRNSVNQKWKYHSSLEILHKDFPNNTLFSRPPPVLA